MDARRPAPRTARRRRRSRATSRAHYFRMMKELALLGYFTSEIGYTKAMRYIEVARALRSVRAACARRPIVGRHA